MLTRNKIKRHIRWWFQRRIRGWDERELWNLDATIAEFIIPRLELFIKTHHGYAGSYTQKEWNDILYKMLDAFKLIIEDTCIKEHEEKIEEGLRLFGENMRGLWD